MNTDEQPAAPMPRREALQMLRARVLQRELNEASINRTCPRMRDRVAASEDDSSLRLVIGAGFSGVGIPRLATFLHRLPSACKPTRVASGAPGAGFWTVLLSRAAGHTRGYSLKSGTKMPVLAGRADTRRRYLHDSVKMRYLSGKSRCSLAWEISEQCVPSAAQSVTSRARLKSPATRVMFRMGHAVFGN